LVLNTMKFDILLGTVVGCLSINEALCQSSYSRVACSGFDPVSLESPVTCTVGADVVAPTNGGLGQVWYNDSIVDTAGWYILDAQADIAEGSVPQPPALLSAAYAAGVAEGILSCQQVHMPPPQALKDVCV
jgi:hypothetical protein